MQKEIVALHKKGKNAQKNFKPREANPTTVKAEISGAIP